MSKKTYIPNARSRILQTAVSIFARQGFNGSSVDQIAKAANVPKSLIYYHFKNKDAMLDALMETCLAQYGQILENAVDYSESSGTEDLLTRIRTVYWKFLEENEDAIRVISMESLKKDSPRAGFAFKFTELLIEIEKSYIAKNGGIHQTDPEAHMVAEFFTSQIPVVIFFCLRETWSQVFKTTPEDLSRQFFDAYHATYGEYQKKWQAESRQPVVE